MFELGMLHYDNDKGFRNAVCLNIEWGISWNGVLADHSNYKLVLEIIQL